jgi:2-polyprenyl-3-methyl-5-hydroxy-6-metoxy-1,4-benzoquinol methylase
MTMTKWSSRQQRHFDRQFEAYNELYGRETPFHAAITQRLVKLSGIQSGEEVLDIGCGFGRITIPLLRAGCRVTALDISGPTLQALHRRVEELHLADQFTPIAGPAEHIDFKKRFTLVTGRGILHHLEDPLDVLRRVYDALIPGGRALFVDPNPLQPLWIPFVLFHPALSWSVERKLWRGTPRRMRRLLQQAGFNEVAHRFIGLVPPPIWDITSRASKIEDWIESVPFIRSLALYVNIYGRRPADL